MENLKVASLDVRGLQKINKRNRIFELIDKHFDLLSYYKKYIVHPKMKIIEKTSGDAPPFFLR